MITSKNITAGYFIVVIAVAFSVTVLSVCKNTGIFAEAGDFNTDTFIHGKYTSALEKKIESKLIIKDAAVGLWGAINFGVFNSGSKGVVIGKNDMLFTDEEFQYYPNGDAEEQKKLDIIKIHRNF